MPSIFIAIARVRDWQAILRFNDEELLKNAHKAGATRYRIHRNLEDASQMLLTIEVPYLDDLDDLVARFSVLSRENILESSVWETVIDGGIG